MITDIYGILEQLLIAAEHPDIAGVSQYEPQGVEITYQSGAKAFIWPTIGVVGKPVDLPAELPAYEFRAQHALKMLVELLEVAKPEGIDAWRTVGVEGVHLAPCALEIRAGQERVLLRVTSGGAPGLDADPATFADYVIPDAVREVGQSAAVG